MESGYKLVQKKNEENLYWDNIMNEVFSKLSYRKIKKKPSANIYIQILNGFKLNWDFLA